MKSQINTHYVSNQKMIHYSFLLKILYLFINKYSDIYLYLLKESVNSRNKNNY